MAGFRDRFFTPRVARAITSPLGIVLFGVGAAASIVAGLPLAAAAGVGALAWGGRVLAAVPGPKPTARVAPQTLSEPWRGYAEQAEGAKRSFDEVVRAVDPGPLRMRLEAMSGRLDDGIEETWKIARRGQGLDQAIARIDTASATVDLRDLRRSVGNRLPSPSEAATARSLEAQIASGERLARVRQEALDQLRLLDARLDELVARTVEVSVGATESDVLDHDVEGLVNELEALRIAMEETDRATQQLPGPSTG